MIEIGRYLTKNQEYAYIRAKFPRARLLEGVVGMHTTYWNFAGKNLESPEWDILGATDANTKTEDNTEKG